MLIYSIGGRKELVLHPVWHFARCTLHRSWMGRMTICSLDVDLSWFGASPLFHVCFCLWLVDLHTDFSGGRTWYWWALSFWKAENEKINVCISCKMGTIKDRNGMDLTEAEDIKKRWQEYTEELYKKKILMTQVTMMVWSLTYSQMSWNAKSSGP